MKRILTIILTVTAFAAACTKSEVQHEASAEIGFAPAAKNVTKAVMEGDLDDNVTLGVWANWNGVEGQVESGISDYFDYDTPFLVNAAFSKKGDNWAGTDQAYLWPTSGALVFAGYTKSQKFVDMTVGVKNATYDFSTNSMSLEYGIYPQLKYSFDLCWFERTTASYNNRTNGNPVEVTLHHALTWLTFNVKGDSATATDDESKKWKVTDMILKGAYKQAQCICAMDSDGNMTAQWTLTQNQTTNIHLGKQNGEDDTEPNLTLPLTQEAQPYEAVKDAIIVIPQTPLKLEVTYQCPTANGYVEKTSEVDLTLTGQKDGEGNDISADERINMWEAGKHYTYTLVFRANEILVAPSYGDWSTSNQTITVE